MAPFAPPPRVRVAFTQLVDIVLGADLLLYALVAMIAEGEDGPGLPGGVEVRSAIWIGRGRGRATVVPALLANVDAAADAGEGSGLVAGHVVQPDFNLSIRVHVRVYAKAAAALRSVDAILLLLAQDETEAGAGALAGEGLEDEG